MNAGAAKLIARVVARIGDRALRMKAEKELCTAWRDANHKERGRLRVAYQRAILQHELPEARGTR